MASRRLLPAFALLLLVLLATSQPARVGDAREYFAMALNLARFSAPAPSDTDIVRLDRQLDRLGVEGLPLAIPALRAPDGRQDFFHFWFYSALAVPGIWLADGLGLNPTLAFVALNVLMFMGAVWVVSRRVAWWVTAAVCCSPVLWWIDKTHTEVFTFSLLAVASVLAREAPWWSMICFGMAATQNPPVASLVICLAAAAPLLRPGAWRDFRFWIGASGAAALAVMHPMYYLWRLGIPTPQLLGGVEPRVPTVSQLGAVLWDSNIGLLFQAPLLAMTILGAAAVLAVRPRTWMRSAEIWLVLASAAIFLVSFAQTPNFNHGGTPGVSRYALWLIPLAIPIVQQAAVVLSASARRRFVPLALASCLWSVVAFHPSLPERYKAPTRVASVIWQRWPWLENPLPEIFSERMSGEEPGLVPVATPGCSKVLLAGGLWPVPCFPQAGPAACASPRALCYANRGRAGYAFVRLEPFASDTLDRQRQRTWVWSLVPESAVQQMLGRLRWRDLRHVSQSAPGAMVRASQNVAWTYGLQSGEELLVYIARPRPGALLTLRLPGAMAGALLDPEAGTEVQPVRIDTPPWALTTFTVPPGRTVALVLARAR